MKFFDKMWGVYNWYGKFGTVSNVSLYFHIDFKHAKMEEIIPLVVWLRLTLLYNKRRYTLVLSETAVASQVPFSLSLVIIPQLLFLCIATVMKAEFPGYLAVPCGPVTKTWPVRRLHHCQGRFWEVTLEQGTFFLHIPSLWNRHMTDSSASSSHQRV